MTIDWTPIKNYQEFESLIRTLLLFQDPTVVELDRDGVDAAQDARSQDGKTVYQCKHHLLTNSNRVIKDAEDEFTKINKYKKHGHVNFKHWDNVESWVMFTNQPFNTNDHAKWVGIIMPLFQSIGIEAEYRERAHIEKLLVEYPEVYRSFFENESRVFLSLPEFELQYQEHGHFVNRTELTPYVGRESDLLKFDKFINSDRKIALVSGPGGIGKTRFLLESCQRILKEGSHQVFWANVETLSTSTNWFSAIVQSKPTLLVVDEPENEKKINLLVEQIGKKGSRTENWKMLLCARSPKDPVIKLIESPKIKSHVFQLQIEPLVNSEVLQMTKCLIDSGELFSEGDEWKNSAATLISNNFDGFPIWINLAVSLLEKHRNLSDIPENSKELCDFYLDEIYTKQNKYEPEQIESTVSFIALLRKFSRNDNAQIDWLQSSVGYEDGDKFDHLLQELIRRKIIGERGAYNRHLLIVPDVVRDHLTRRLMLLPNHENKSKYKISRKAKSILDGILLRARDNSVTQIDSLIIKSIFKLELFLSFENEPLHFSAHFFKQLEDTLYEMNTTAKIATIGLLNNIGNFAPNGTIQFAKKAFSHETAPETVKGIFKEKLVTHLHAQEELIEPLYSAMLSATSPDDMRDAMDLMTDLANIDNTDKRRNNRRRSAASDKVRSVIEGGPHIRKDYGLTGLAKAKAILSTVITRPPNNGEKEIISVIFNTLTTHKRKQIWGESGSIVFRTQYLHEDSERFEIRNILVNTAKEYLSLQTLNMDTRLLLWRIIEEIHFNTYQYYRSIKHELEEPEINDERDKADDVNTIYFNDKVPISILNDSNEIIPRLEKEVLQNLEWILNLSQMRNISTLEHKGIRNIWQWHLDHDLDEDRITISEQIKEIYLECSEAKEFEFIENDRYGLDKNDAYKKKAKDILENKDDSIANFVGRAIDFYGEDSASNVGPIVYYIGEQGQHDKSVLDYINNEFEINKNVRTQLAINAARGLINTIRNEDINIAIKILDSIMTKIKLDSICIQLLSSIYGTPYQVEPNKLHDREMKYIRSHEELFAKNDESNLFIACVCWSIGYKHTEYKDILTRNINRSNRDVINQSSVNYFISGVFWWLKKDGHLPDKFNTWFLDQIFRASRLPHGTHLLGYEVEEIISKLGKAPLDWLVKTLKLRRDLEKQDPNFKALNGDIEFIEVVDQISEKNMDDQNTSRHIHELFELFKDNGTVGYHMPNIVHSLDYDEMLIPTLYAEVTKKDSAFANLTAWVELPSKYEFNSRPWRTMSRALLDIANNQENNQKYRIYRTIIERGSEIFEYVPGTVPLMFHKDVEEARKHSNNESEDVFHMFWSWYLQRAERRLQIEEEEAKEARGE